MSPNGEKKSPTTTTSLEMVTFLLPVAGISIGYCLSLYKCIPQPKHTGFGILDQSFAWAQRLLFILLFFFSSLTPLFVLFVSIGHFQSTKNFADCIDGHWAVPHTERLSDLSTWFFGDTYEYYRRFILFVF